MSPSYEIFVLFMTLAVGAVLGRLSWRGLSLGTSAVIFVALFVGHLGYSIPDNVGLLGLIVFVFCIGINAGPRFFHVFREQAGSLALLGAVMLVAAVAATCCFARILGLPADLAAGIFAGSLTSTPALAAAAEALPPDSQLAVGFGIAYPFGAIGVVLFVQLASKFRTTLDADDEPLETDPLDAKITREVVEICNPSVVNRRVSDLEILDRCNCQVSRVRVGHELTPIDGSFKLELGQQLLVIGATPEIKLVVEFLGRSMNSACYVVDTEQNRRRVVVTSDEVVGRSLKDLHLRSRFGVTISRIMRHDIEFVPQASQTIQFGDALTAIGHSGGLESFVEHAGHRERSFDETDLISLIVGLFLGVVLGQVHFQLGKETFSLGMAGGPLVVGLLMGHFGRLGPLVGHFPRAARLLLTEIGLALFLASAGVQAGGQLLSVVQQHGLGICFAAILITAIPLLVGALLTRYSIRMGVLRSLGGICGVMTSTPGLGAITSQTDSNIPLTSYATIYPVALILMSLLAPILVSVMS